MMKSFTELQEVPLERQNLFSVSVFWVLHLNVKQLETGYEISFAKHYFTEFAWLLPITKDINFQLQKCSFQRLMAQHTRNTVPSTVENCELHATSSSGLPNKEIL